ncbi:MAG: cell division protein ZapE [Aquisalimonadaceae bacterium]
MTPWQRYQADLQRPEFVADASQEAAVRALQALYDEVLEAPEPPSLGRLWSLLGRRAERQPVRGLYLWGGVGRGKTYLMDTFHEALPFEDKQRMHFHRFMQQVHAQLKTLRDRQNPLTLVAARFAEQARVLCFDEFFVSDIADAMILSGLLEGLFREGVTLVATSNIPPDQLYRDGLQRQRFLPAIRLLNEHTRVLNVDGGTDYRLRYLEQAEIYHSPLDEEAEAILEEEFERLGPEQGEREGAIEINGRRVAVRGLSDDVVWFDFAAICDGPRGQEDYIEIAREFHTVLIGRVPVLGLELENQARRFISLVDEFYDRNVKLIIAAAEPAERLYQGKRLRFEFQRTVSRLEEMQSHAYLARPHRP